MKQILTILFLVVSVIAKSQFYVQVNWGNNTAIYYTNPVDSPANVYATIYNVATQDSFGNPKYIFKPLTPPNFTNSDIIINPLTQQMKTADSMAVIQHAVVVSSLKSLAYKGLNGFTLGSTLTAAQIQEALQVLMWNAGMFNPATNKTDSIYNGGYIK